METAEKIRAFLAIELNDRQTIAKILDAQTALQSKLGPLKLTDLKILHLTLCFYGDISIKQAENVYNNIVVPINSKYFSAPLKSEIKGVGKFGKNVYFIKMENNIDILQEIVDFIREQNSKMNMSFDNKNFNPHLTIARSKSGRAPAKNYGALWNEWENNYKNMNFGPFTLNRIHLKKSTLTPKGPIYENLEF